MATVTYVGDRLPALRGRTALQELCPDRPDLVQLQFDGYDGESLPLCLTHRWMRVRADEVVAS